MSGSTATGPRSTTTATGSSTVAATTRSTWPASGWGPPEVESILAEHGAVAESAAIGVPDSVKGEVIHCFAVLNPGHEPTDVLRAELRDRVAQALGKSFAPDEVRFRGRAAQDPQRQDPPPPDPKVALGQDPGDLSSLENLTALEAIRRAD